MTDALMQAIADNYPLAVFGGAGIVLAVSVMAVEIVRRIMAHHRPDPLAQTHNLARRPDLVAYRMAGWRENVHAARDL